MAWIKMRTDLLSDPRIAAIGDELHRNACVTENCDGRHAHVTAIGCCYALWALADTHSTDGRMVHMTTERLDRMLGVVGFAAAAVRVGWLKVVENWLEIPRFDKHNGESAKARANAAARQAASRSRHKKAQPEKRREEKKSNTPLSPPKGGHPNGSARKRTRPMTPEEAGEAALARLPK